MTYEISADPEVAVEYHRRFFPGIVRGNQKGLTLLKDNEPLAAVLYDNYSGANVFMHVAADPGRKWLNRWFLHEAFKYPFVTLACQRVTGWVEENNSDAIRFNEHLGFRREAVLERAGERGQDVFLYVMFREDCRYA